MAWLWLVPALLVLLACLPVGLAFDVSSVPSWHGAARLSWAWFFHTRIPLGKRRSRGEPRPEPAGKRNPAAARRSLRLSVVQAVLSLLLDLGRRLYAATTVKDLGIHTRAGLEDPADTGMLCGWLSPLFASLAPRDRRHLFFEPEFTGACLEVDATGRVVIVPARYLLVMLQVLVAPRTWRLAYLLVRA